MNLIGPSCVIYLIVGIGVAGAVYLSHSIRAKRWLGLVLAIPFWPLFLPILLSEPRSISEEAESAQAQDALADAITQVNTELDTALSSLDGWAEDVLAREKGRIRELRTTWTVQAERIREMDRLLSLPAYGAAVDGENESGPRAQRSRQARQQNLERLRLVRQHAFENLMSTLAWVRELVSMIHLAKFTGAPASRAEELVTQIAAAVEGVSELSRQDVSCLSEKE